MRKMSAELPTPPRWSRTILERVLSSSSMCPMILGDLHEEFVADALAGRRFTAPQLLASGVIALTIAVNTLAYALVSTFPSHWLVSVVGALGFAFMIACAALASGMVCDALLRRGVRSELQETLHD